MSGPSEQEYLLREADRCELAQRRIDRREFITRSLVTGLGLAGVVDLHRAWELHLSNDAVVEFLGGSPTEVPDHYREASPIDKPIPQATQKLIHGTTDTSVPYEISQHYVERKKKQSEKVELITLPDTGHFEIVDPSSSVWNKVQEAFID